jgi:hypothetical protein
LKPDLLRIQAGHDLCLIDLSRITLSDTIFVREPEIDHEEVKFLKTFRHEISRPIELDDRIHIEYVPTQVLTEFFRYCFEPETGPVHGMIYPSSTSPGGENVILFCDEFLRCDRYQSQNQTPWIEFLRCVEPRSFPLTTDNDSQPTLL